VPFDDTGNRNILIQLFPAQGRTVCTQGDLLELFIAGFAQQPEASSRETDLATRLELFRQPHLLPALLSVYCAED
jgi:hypothetical protein